MDEKKPAENKKTEEDIKENSGLPKEQIDKKMNRQLAWAIVLMVGLIIVIVLVPYVIENFINQFTYINLDFQKTKLGDILFYSTRIPIADKQAKITGAYAMNFREDPRELEDVKVNMKDNIVKFKKNNTVYISLDPEMQACEDNSIALMNLAGFLRDFAGLEVKSAVNNKTFAEENGMNYADCENSPYNTVIYINSGNETSISEIGNCYQLIYSDCEILEVTEKFMLVILENYMSYFVRE